MGSFERHLARERFGLHDIDSGRWRSNSLVAERAPICDTKTGEKLKTRPVPQMALVPESNAPKNNGMHPIQRTTLKRPHSAAAYGPAYSVAFMHPGIQPRLEPPDPASPEPHSEPVREEQEHLASSKSTPSFMHPTPLGSRNIHTRRGAGSSDQFWRAQPTSEQTTIHAPTRDDEARQIPILLPHKLDWVQLAYSRTDDFRKAVDEREHARLRARQHARAQRDETRANWRRTTTRATARAVQASERTPDKQWGAISAFVRRDEAPLPQSPSSQLFRHKDLGLNEYKSRLVELREPPRELSSVVNAASAGRPALIISRAQSESMLDTRLAALGATRRWQGGPRDRQGADANDKWSPYSFDRLVSFLG